MHNKQVSSFYNSIASHYEEDYEEPVWTLYNDITWHNLKKHLPKPGSLILDAGGGTGLWSRKLARLGYKVVCTDISPKMLKTGKIKAKKLKIKFKQADICNMSQFKSNTFNLVIAQGDVISYCQNPDKAIKELKRLTKKNSKIIISVNTFFSALNNLITNNKFDQIDLLLKTGNTDDIIPKHHFKISELKQLIKKHNLKLESIIGKFSLINNIPTKKLNQLLNNKDNYNKILALETKFNSNPELLTKANHIEIVCSR